MARKRKSRDTPVAVAEDPEWEARHSFDTLVRAQEIMADKALMKRVRAHADKQTQRAARVARLNGKEI